MPSHTHGSTPHSSGRKGPGQAGQKQARSAEQKSPEGDLKAREYRDEHGNVHHHTQKYMQQHGGSSGESTGSSTGGSARQTTPSAQRATSSRARGAAQAEQQGTEEGVYESEESADEVEAQVTSLLAVAQMDSEAAVAYESVAELIDAADVQQQLRSFARDHRRHVEDLGKLIQQLGGEPEAAAPPPEDSTFARLASALAMLGPRAALLSLTGNEQFTNATYETALELMADGDAIALLERNFEDEQRHLSWLTEHTEEDDEASSDDS